jgi:hypothetical protein
VILVHTSVKRETSAERHPRAGRRKGLIKGKRLLGRPSVLALTCVVVMGFLCGCGGSSASRSEQELVVERALNAALQGEKAEFVTLVAPSFLGQARAEMPDVDDEILGGILIAGFLEDIPFSGIVEASYEVEADGDEAVIYVWGLFLGPDGREMEIDKAEALRIPLVKEGGLWYLDLLDL